VTSPTGESENIRFLFVFACPPLLERFKSRITSHRLCNFLGCETCHFVSNCLFFCNSSSRCVHTRRKFVNRWLERCSSHISCRTRTHRLPLGCETCHCIAWFLQLFEPLRAHSKKICERAVFISFLSHHSGRERSVLQFASCSQCDAAHVPHTHVLNC
jgi:hypothetical protein